MGRAVGPARLRLLLLVGGGAVVGMVAALVMAALPSSRGQFGIPGTLLIGAVAGAAGGFLWWFRRLWPNE